MIRIKRLGHVLLRTRDIEQQIAFYCEVLGFDVLEHDGDMAFLSLQDSSHTIDLLQLDKNAPEINNVGALHHIAFELNSFEELREAYYQLKAEDVEILRSVDHKTQQSIYFKDRDGNRLELYSEVDGAREMFLEGRQDEDEILVFE